MVRVRASAQFTTGLAMPLRMPPAPKFCPVVAVRVGNLQERSFSQTRVDCRPSRLVGGMLVRASIAAAGSASITMASLNAR